MMRRDKFSEFPGLGELESEEELFVSLDIFGIKNKAIGC